MNNPFIVTGRYISPEFFCDRENETAELLSNIQNWRNTVLISLRRMGKSGLIHHLYNLDAIMSDYETFFIDIYDTENIEDFVFLLSKEITVRLQSKGMRLFERFLQIVNSIKISFGTDPLTGQPGFDISLGDIKNPAKTLQQLFEFLEASEKPCIVAIDEFQQIADYKSAKKDIATLRTLVQGCKKTRFIFAGSNRRMMGHLFQSPSEPFFMSCSPIILEPIDKERYTEFVKYHFHKNGKDILPNSINYVYDKFDGHTWFIQYLFNRLFETAGDKPVTIDDANSAVEYIIDIFAPIFQEMFMGMSERQRSLLSAIAKEGKVTSITGTQFIMKYNLRSASAVQGALKPLLKNETVISQQGTYFISNRFYSIWLARRY